MSSTPTADAGLALSGVRVLDLTWAIAGPVCTRVLADQGAEVLKLESANSMDPSRMGGPWLKGVNTFPDGGGGFTGNNRNKLSATLNLKSSEGRELFLQLVTISDVVVNNYSAGSMDRLGLGYDVLQAANPGIVLAELSGMGQTGPYRRHFAYGQTVMALAGGYELTGYRDGPPLMPGYTLPDQASGTIGAFAIISALIWRRRTGLGQHLDLGLLQVAASLMAEPQIAALTNNVDTTRAGNHETGALVHGCFRSAGEDAWCVIVVRTESEWDALRAVIGGALPESMHDARALDVEAIIEAWTEQRTAREVMETLQGVGVEAARVQNARDIYEDDEHIAARGYFETYDHLIGEKAVAEGIPFKMSETPAHIRRPGPIYGIDNDYVFAGLLHLTEPRIRTLRDAGVIT